jgi:L-rhamnose mutarotase
MIRKGFVMSLRPGHEAEYQRRHDALWPEMAAVLKDHGVHAYSIFLDAATGRLFASVQVEDEARWAAIAETEVCRRWWAYMRDIMDTDDAGRPLATELREVFFLP